MGSRFVHHGEPIRCGFKGWNEYPSSILKGATGGGKDGKGVGK